MPGVATTCRRCSMFATDVNPDWQAEICEPVFQRWAPSPPLKMMKLLQLTVLWQGALEPGEAAEVVVTFYIVGGPEGTANMLTQAQVSTQHGSRPNPRACAAC